MWIGSAPADVNPATATRCGTAPVPTPTNVNNPFRLWCGYASIGDSPATSGNHLTIRMAPGSGANYFVISELIPYAYA